MNKMTRIFCALGGMFLAIMCKISAGLLASTIGNGSMSMIYAIVHPLLAILSIIMFYKVFEGAWPRKKDVTI